MKKLLLVFTTLLTVCACLSINTINANSNRVVDNATLLTSDEEYQLEQTLQSVSQELNMDIVVLTTYTTDGLSTDLYAANFYDDNNYGLDDLKSGVILCINMTEREYQVVNTGYAIDVYDGQEASFDNYFIQDLSNGDYLDAFLNFSNACRYCYADYSESMNFNYLKSGVISLGIGVIVATIVCLVKKSKHKSVRTRYEAINYIVPGSLNINIANDILLNVTTSRVKRQKEPSNSGKSSSHSFKSSSGVSHSSHGGKF